MVTLSLTASGVVFGNVRFYDSRAKRTRTFRIAPVIKAQAAAAATPDAAAAGLFPEYDSSKHVVVEYKEPNLPRKMVVPTPEQLAAASATSTADAGAPAPSPVLLGDVGGRRRLRQSGNVRQDLLVVYTPAAAARSGGVQAVEATIRNTVAATQKAYSDTGISITLNLVGIRQVRCTCASW